MTTTRRVVVRYSYLLISVILIVDAIATISLLSMGCRVFTAPSVDSWMLALAMLGLGIVYSVLFIRDHRNNITNLDYSTFSMILQLGVAGIWITVFFMDIPTFIKLIYSCL